MTEHFHPDPLYGLRPEADPLDPRAPALLRPHLPGDPLRGARVLLGLPYDGGVPSRPGARFGPRAAREALGAFGVHDGRRDARGALDLGDLALPTTSGRLAHARIETAAERIFAAGARPLFVGGDHGCTGSVIRGLARARPGLRLALVTVDAHLDVREYPDEEQLSSGTPFRRALESPILEGGRVAMIGLRAFANSAHYLGWARDRGIHLITVDDVAELGAQHAAARALEAVCPDADALYLSVDLDAADAAIAPGVSAPGVGGLTAREMITLVGALAAHPLLVGCDLMELCPPLDPDGRTARLAARLMLEMML